MALSFFPSQLKSNDCAAQSSLVELLARPGSWRHPNVAALSPVVAVRLPRRRLPDAK